MHKVMTSAKGSMEPYLVTEQPGQILEERGGGQGWQEDVHSPRHRQLLLLCPKEGDVIFCEACPKHKVSAGTRWALV